MSLTECFINCELLISGGSPEFVAGKAEPKGGDLVKKLFWQRTTISHLPFAQVNLAAHSRISNDRFAASMGQGATIGGSANR